VPLAAAGLGLRERHLVAEPLKQPHGRLADLREQAIRQAGHEQRDPHG
jgi:hypothetical protein